MARSKKIPKVSFRDQTQRDKNLTDMILSQPDEQRDFARLTEKRYEVGVRFREDKEARWELIERLLAGEHFEAVAEMRGTSNTVDGWAKGHTRSRFVENHMPTLLNSYVAAITGGNPVARFRPATSSYDNRKIARMEEELTEWTWQQTKMDRSGCPRSARWMGITGTGIVKLYWNDTASRSGLVDLANPQADPETAMRSLGQTSHSPSEVSASPNVNRVVDEMMAKGWLNSYDLHPRKLVLAPMVPSIERSPWVIEAHLFYASEAERYWPEAAKLRKPPTAEGMAHVISFRQKAALGIEDLLDELLVIFETYELPTLKYRNGRFALVCNGYCLKYAEDVGPFGYPYYLMADNEVDDDAHGFSFADPSVPLQYQLDVAISQFMDRRNEEAYPPYLLPKGCEVAVENLDGTDRTVVRYNPAKGKPEKWDPTPISDSLILSQNINRQQIFHTAGSPEFMQGQTPADKVFSGRALGFAVDLFRQMMSPKSSKIDGMVEWWGERAVRLIHHYAPPKLLYWVVGRDNALDVREFETADINTFEIRVQPGSMLTKNKELERDRLIELLGTGVVPPDPTYVWKLMDIGGFQELIGNRTNAMRKAQDENEALLRGDLTHPPVPVWYDDHKAHREEHVDVTYSKMYLEADAPHRAALEAHLQQHLALELQMGQIVQALAQNAPKPGGKGGAPPGGGPAAEPGVRTQEEGELAAGAGISGARV